MTDVFMVKHTLQPAVAPDNEPGAILISTDRLQLRRVLVSDAAAMAAAANHESVARYMRDRFPSPYTLADSQRYLAVADRHITPGSEVNMVILLRPGTADNPGPEPVAIGSIGSRPGVDVNYRTWELGYWLTPSAWGRGLAAEAARAFVGWCFETWPRLNRFSADAVVVNEGSVALLKKVGFRVEGVRRGVLEKRGALLDDVVLGLLRTDWQASRAASQ